MVTDINSWNERIIAEFRSNAGHVSWSTDDDLIEGRPLPPRLPAFGERPGVPIILVHHTGAKTGRERINPMMYQLVGEDFAVFATYGGSPHNPAWYRNLMANPRATVEVGTEMVPVAARLAVGLERERIWAEQIALMPAFAEFEAAAARQIPVLVLERVHDDPPPSDSDHREMRIGELARRTGASTRSLRYYEQRGLLTSRRDRNGYRRYSNDVVHLVINLRRLLSAGLSVADIQQFGSCVTSPDLGSSPCLPALQVYDQRLNTLDDQIAALTHLRDNLAEQAKRLRARIQRRHDHGRPG